MSYGYPPQQGYPPQGFPMQTQGFQQNPFMQYGQMYTMPPPNIDPGVANWFRHVDTDRSGFISAQELVNALSMGGWVPFSLEATTSMIKMFNSSGTGQLNLIEFQHLVTYLNQMRHNFVVLDTDRSGRLDYNEVMRALHMTGHMFDPRLLPKILHKFDRTRRNSLGLDGYIELCLFLGTTREVFGAHDYSRQGVITMTYDQFLNASLAMQFGLRS